MRAIRNRLYHLLGVALLLGTVMPAVRAQAQTGGPTVLFDGPCEVANPLAAVPEVNCTISVLDASGVPITGLTATQLQVSIDANVAVSNVRIASVVSETRTLNTVLVLDLGATAPGLDEAALKQAARRVLEALPDRDRVALIAITGKIDLGDTLNPPIDPLRETAFVQAGPGRNAVINLITALKPPGNTPLYDAVCKALILAAKENVGSRAVVVISDGRDIKSSTCISPDDPITRANRDKTPIYAIGIGNNLIEDYLRRVTFQTGGRYLERATDAEGIATRFRQVQAALKTQYSLRFAAPVSLTGRAHVVNVSVDLPGGKREARGQFSLPKGIIIKSLRFRVADRDVQARDLPPNTEITVDPELDAPAVTRAEYEINGIRLQSDKQPFAVTLPPSLPTGQELTLTVRVINASVTPPMVMTATERLRVRPVEVVALPTLIPLPTATPAPASFLSGTGLWLVLGGLALLLAAIGGFLWWRSRKPSEVAVQSLDNVSYEESPSMIADRTASDVHEPTAIVQDSTVVMRAPEFSPPAGDHTLVLRPPLAKLYIDLPGLRDTPLALGGPLGDVLVIGREVSGPTALKLPSQYISRNHAEIARREDGLWLTDLGSASGTKLNGERMNARDPRRINVGDRIEFADVRAEVRAA